MTPAAAHQKVFTAPYKLYRVKNTQVGQFSHEGLVICFLFLPLIYWDIAPVASFALRRARFVKQHQFLANRSFERMASAAGDVLVASL